MTAVKYAPGHREQYAVVSMLMVKHGHVHTVGLGLGLVHDNRSFSWF